MVRKFAWRDEVLDYPDLKGWSVHPMSDPPGWRLSGLCPACNHATTAIWVDEVYRGAAATSVAALSGPVAQLPEPAEVINPPIVIRCQCRQEDSHGENRLGCGRSWTAVISS